jgi:hypothetical protein
MKRIAIQSVCPTTSCRRTPPAIDRAAEQAALWFYTLVLAGACACGFVRLYAYVDTLSLRNPRNTTMSMSRPRPLRTAASVIGGLTALVSGLVGSGLLTGGQGNALTGIITAVIAVLAAFGITVATENKVTPITDPRDRDGQPLIPAAPADTD